MDKLTRSQQDVATRKPQLRKQAQKPAVEPVVEQQPEPAASPQRAPSRDGKINLSYWVDKDTRVALGKIWLNKGILRVQDGMADVVELYLRENGADDL